MSRLFGGTSAILSNKTDNANSPRNTARRIFGSLWWRRSGVSSSFRGESSFFHTLFTMRETRENGRKNKISRPPAGGTTGRRRRSRQRAVNGKNRTKTAEYRSPRPHNLRQPRSGVQRPGSKCRGRERDRSAGVIAGWPGLAAGAGADFVPGGRRGSGHF